MWMGILDGRKSPITLARSLDWPSVGLSFLCFEDLQIIADEQGFLFPHTQRYELRYMYEKRIVWWLEITIVDTYTIYLSAMQSVFAPLHPTSLSTWNLGQNTLISAAEQNIDKLDFIASSSFVIS